jgi:hypothetical protein
MTRPPAPEPAGAAEPPRAGHVATRDLLAVVALVVGSLVLPVLGWLVGIGLLWTSPTWRVGEKIVGTLVWPGGLLVPLALPLLPIGAQLLRSPGLAMTLITVLVVAPMIVGGWLLLRARQRAAAGADLTPRRSP